MATKCPRCQALIDEEIGLRVAEKQAKVRDLLSEIHAIRGEERLHQELEALQESDTPEETLSAISHEDETLKLKLEKLLEAMRERKTLNDLIRTGDICCQHCEDLEIKLRLKKKLEMQKIEVEDLIKQRQEEAEFFQVDLAEEGNLLKLLQSLHDQEQVQGDHVATGDEEGRLSMQAILDSTAHEVIALENGGLKLIMQELVQALKERHRLNEELRQLEN